MKRGERHFRGQSLVEFALVVPIFVVLLFGMVEFGRAWMTKNIITGAAREAVRIYAVDNTATGWALARTRAENVMTSGGLDPVGRGRITPSETPISLTETEMGVLVEYDFPVIIIGFIPGLPGDNILLRTTSTMRKE